MSEESQEMREVVLARSVNLQRDDGTKVTYEAGSHTIPVADAEHWYLKHHLAPDGKESPGLLSDEPTPGRMQDLIAARDTAMVDIATLKRENRRITDLWTETSNRLRAREVELSTLQAAQGTASRPGEPPEANSQMVILQGRLAAALKDAEERSVETRAATERAEAAEARVRELEGLINNTALAEAGGSPAAPPPSSDDDAEGEDEQAETTEVKVVRQGKKFRVSRNGQLSEESYPTRAAAQKALDEGAK